MKKKIFMIIIFVFIFCPFLTRAQWSNIYVSQNLWELSIINKDTVFVTGENAILRTTNGGSTWNNLMAEPFWTYSVDFANDSVGMVSGHEKIIKTTDGGNTWSVIKSSANADFIQVYFPKETLGLALSRQSPTDTIFRTTDGGQSWEPVFSRTLIKNLQLLDENTGYLISDNFLYDSLFKTVDGGLTWSYLPIDTLIISEFHIIKNYGFVNANTGIIWCLDDSYLKTIDGGVSWELLGFDILPGYLYMKFVSRDDIDFYFSGWDPLVPTGAIYYSGNGGHNWTWQKLGLFNDLALFNDTIGYAVDVQHGIYKTMDGGFAGISQFLTIKTGEDFSIYPNPVTNNITIFNNTNVYSDIEISIVNSYGEVVCDKILTADNTYNIEFNGYSDGLYFYYIKNNSKILQRGKLIKIN